ncbi:hypothetical protein GW17_00054507 [Ensete ventricosum]|nr:hypothetical protein GW17_00054507 [Ensete ventricosum]RZR98500.1 hypothetical protein BHM03_00027853 [Ensete ventricosum]
MRLGTRVECVGSLPRVSRACQDGVREFVGRRPRLAGRLSGAAEKLTGSWEGLDDVMGARRVFARTSLKISRRSLGTRREIAGRRP